MCAHKRLFSVKSFPHYLHLNLNAECVISMWYSKCFFDDNLKLHLSHFLIPPCAGKGCPSYVRISYLRVAQGLLSYLCLANTNNTDICSNHKDTSLWYYRYMFARNSKNARSVENGLQWAWALRNMCLLTLGRCILNVRSVDQVFHRKVLWRFTCKIILGRNLYMSVVLKGVFSLCYVEETYIDPY